MYDSGKKKMLVEHVGTPDELAEAYIFAMKVSQICAALFHGLNGDEFCSARISLVRPLPSMVEESSFSLSLCQGLLCLYNAH